MDTFLITIRYKPADVSRGLVRTVALGVVRTLNPLRGEDHEAPGDDVRLRFTVEALNENEALRTARCVEGAIKPLVTTNSVRSFVGPAA